MYMYINIYIYIYEYIYIHMYVYTHIHMYINLYTYVCIYMYVYICICVYTYILYRIYILYSIYIHMDGDLPPPAVSRGEARERHPPPRLRTRDHPQLLLKNGSKRRARLREPRRACVSSPPRYPLAHPSPSLPCVPSPQRFTRSTHPFSSHQQLQWFQCPCNGSKGRARLGQLRLPGESRWACVPFP